MTGVQKCALPIYFMEYLSDGKINEDDPLVTSMAQAVEEANGDRRWVGKVFSVSTMGEDMERELRIWRRMGLKEGRKEGRKEGHKEGLEEGLIAGRVEGLKEADARYSALIEKLFADGRIDEVREAAADADLRQRLFEEYGL